MYRRSSITRKLEQGGLAALAAIATLAFGTAGAEAAPAKAATGQTVAAPGTAKAISASNGGGRPSSKRRKRCKAPKVAVRRRGRIRCVRPKQAIPPPTNTQLPPPQQADPQGSAPATHVNPGSSPAAQQPTAEQVSDMERKAAASITIRLARSWDQLVGCYGPYLHANGFWYGYCAYVVMYGTTPLGVGKRVWLWWDSQQSRWNLWDVEQFAVV